MSSFAILDAGILAVMLISLFAMYFVTWRLEWLFAFFAILGVYIGWWLRGRHADP